mmetsp:Transcript_7414/g.24405  ORF Transcript_7414/g.24405 Transcript_7414/m.24405 type:complete len:208 (+) Transcript_7414:11-634(+)
MLNGKLQERSPGGIGDGDEAMYRGTAARRYSLDYPPRLRRRAARRAHAAAQRERRDAAALPGPGRRRQEGPGPGERRRAHARRRAGHARARPLQHGHELHVVDPAAPGLPGGHRRQRGLRRRLREKTVEARAALQRAHRRLCGGELERGEPRRRAPPRGLGPEHDDSELRPPLRVPDREQRHAAPAPLRGPAAPAEGLLRRGRRQGQ